MTNTARRIITDRTTSSSRAEEGGAGFFISAALS
jgi:hypothetical protein